MIFKNVSGQGVYIFAYDRTTGEGLSGDSANFTIEISLDGGDFATLADTSPDDKGDGDYWYTLTQAETNADVIKIRGESTTSNIIVVGVPIITDGGVLSDGADTRAGSLGTASGIVQNESLVSADTIATSVWSSTTRTLTSFGTLVADTATAVWASTTRTLSSFGTLTADTATAVWGSTTRTLSSFGTLTTDTATAVWAHVVGLTTTAGTALNKLICRLVHNTTASGTQFYEDDNTTPHDSVTISENDRTVDTE